MRIFSIYSNRQGGCYTLAEDLAECVSMAEDFELLAPIELSICCFRYVPSLLVTRLQSGDEAERASVHAEIDRLKARILFALQPNGRAYLSNTTTICGRYALGACIVNFRTTCADIDAILDIVRDTRTHKLDKSGTRKVNVREGLEILLPNRQNLGDYPARIREAIHITSGCARSDIKTLKT